KNVFPTISRRDHDLWRELRTKGLGVVQRPIDAHFSKHVLVLHSRHAIRRQRPDYLRPAQPARIGAFAFRPRFWAVAAVRGGKWWRAGGDFDPIRNAGPCARHAAVFERARHATRSRQWHMGSHGNETGDRERLCLDPDKWSGADVSRRPVTGGRQP